MKTRWTFGLIACVGLVAADPSPAAAGRITDMIRGRKPAATPQPQATPEPVAPQPTPAPEPEIKPSSPPPAKPGASPAAAESAPDLQPSRTLEEHGIGTSNRELISFLQKGVSASKMSRWPQKPVEKSQLAIDAMARLAKAKSRDAVSVLSQIAALRLPEGVATLLQHDLAQTAPATRAEFQQKAMRLLRFNAVNALGLIGDQSGLDAVRAAYTQETNPAARIQYALNLASLGDASGVDFLLEQIDRHNRRESAAAARVFNMITGQDFGYTENTALRARRTKSKQYRDWWRQNRAQFAPDPRQIAERRVTPQAPPSYQPRSTRDLLKAASYYFDIHDKLGSVTSRKTLKSAGRTLNPELERISLDPLEDLDIRLEAINWYYENNRSGARGLLGKLRRDENPEVVDKANTLLAEITKDQESPHGMGR